jgi:RNA polymerase sigma-70 factor (ECF subfamily)
LVPLKNITIQLFKKGDPAAFREVFELHYKRICAFGYRYIPDASEVEDIIQDVFLSLWERRKDFDHPDSIKTFLYTTARNKCLNYLKHKKVVRKHEAPLVKELESDQFFIDHVIEEEVFGQLHMEIKMLPKASQKIMMLSLRGKKIKEIAQQLGISENTVKTQKKLAYAKLRTKLSSDLKGILLSI